MIRTLVLGLILLSFAGVAQASHAPGSRAWCAIVTGDETASCKKH